MHLIGHPMSLFDTALLLLSPLMEHFSIGILHRRVRGGSRYGVSSMDPLKCQTATVSPAEPGDFP